MNMHPKPPDSLEQTDLVASLLPDAIVQLEKDFVTSGMDVQLAGQIIGDVFDLRDRVAGLVAQTGGPGSEKFYRLLYRADIPESKVRDVLASSPGGPVESEVAELLIIRALQKAFYRRQYH